MNILLAIFFILVAITTISSFFVCVAYMELLIAVLALPTLPKSITVRCEYIYLSLLPVSLLMVCLAPISDTQFAAIWQKYCSSQAFKQRDLFLKRIYSATNFILIQNHIVLATLVPVNFNLQLLKLAARLLGSLEFLLRHIEEFIPVRGTSNMHYEEDMTRNSDLVSQPVGLGSEYNGGS